MADRFHVVRIVMEHFTQLARELARIRYDRGFPALEPLYRKMRQICDLLNLKAQKRRKCFFHARELLRHIEDLKTVGFKQLKTLARTLASWAEPIAAMWRFRKTNSITEGFHRKMKLIQRRAYGFSSELEERQDRAPKENRNNFENYRLRVIAHCG